MFRAIFDNPNRYDKCGSISAAALELECIRNLALLNDIPGDIVGVIIGWRVVIAVANIYTIYERYLRDIITIYFNPGSSIFVENDCIDLTNLERIMGGEYTWTKVNKCFYYGDNSISILSMQPGISTKVLPNTWLEVINLICAARPKVMRLVGGSHIYFRCW